MCTVLVFAQDFAAHPVSWIALLLGLNVGRVGDQ
jgi:hypothetical protein